MKKSSKDKPKEKSGARASRHATSSHVRVSTPQQTASDSLVLDPDQAPGSGEVSMPHLLSNAPRSQDQGGRDKTNLGMSSSGSDTQVPDGQTGRPGRSPERQTGKLGRPASTSRDRGSVPVKLPLTGPLVNDPEVGPEVHPRDQSGTTFRDPIQLPTGYDELPDPIPDLTISRYRVPAPVNTDVRTDTRTTLESQKGSDLKQRHSNTGFVQIHVPSDGSAINSPVFTQFQSNDPQGPTRDQHHESLTRPVSPRRSRQRSPSAQKKYRKRHSHRYKHKRHASSYSSTSTSSSRSRSRSRRRHRRKHHSRSPSYHKHRHHYKKTGHKRPRSSSSSCSSEYRRSKNKTFRKEQSISVSSDRTLRHHSSPIRDDPELSNPDISIILKPQDNVFEKEDLHQRSSDKTLHSQHSMTEENSDERILFSQVIDEIYNLLPSDKFPRKVEADSHTLLPKSSIEAELNKEEKKSLSLPQSPLISQTFQYIQKKFDKKNISDGWSISGADIKPLVSMKHYQVHSEKVPTSKETDLDKDASKLGLSLSGSCQIPIKNLDNYEKQLGELLQVLSHSDIFSLAAFKCLQQETLNPNMLSRLLESLAMSIKHSVSLASCLTIELQQARRDAAIHSSKILTDEAKTELRGTPFVNETLFGGQINEVYQRNAEIRRNELITNTLCSTSKKQTSATATSSKPSFTKPLPPKKPKQSVNSPKSSHTPNPSRPSRGGSFRGLGRGNRGGFPSSRGASSSKKF